MSLEGKLIVFMSQGISHDNSFVEECLPNNWLIFVRNDLSYCSDRTYIVFLVQIRDQHPKILVKLDKR